MKGFRLFQAIGFVLISSSALSLNPVQGWYVGAVGGVTYAPNVNFDVINPLNIQKINGEVTYLIGGNVGGQIGYRCGKIRLEIEGLFNETKYQQMALGDLVLHDYTTPNLLHMSGYTYFASGFINGIYEFYQQGSEMTNFVPYLGIGLGYANVNNSLSVFYDYNLVDSAITSSSSAGIAQAILGFNYFIDDFAAVGLDYRYIITSNSGEFNTSYQAQTINVSFTYAFGN